MKTWQFFARATRRPAARGPATRPLTTWPLTIWGLVAAGLAVGGLTGCSEGSDATGGGSCGVGPGQECPAGCSQRTARPYDADEACLGDAQPVACVPSQDCTAVLTYAEDDSGDVWRFSSGCIPDGWSEVSSAEAPDDPDVCAEQEPACSELSLDDCAAETERCSLIVGNELDQQAECLHNSMDLACGEAVACGDGAITHATDDTGNIWQFSTTCVPDGWEVTQAPENVVEWSLCE